MRLQCGRAAKSLRTTSCARGVTTNYHRRCPDFSRTKEALESLSFSDLSMVGFLSLGDELLALIENPEGEIFRVGVGSYMGLNHGRVWRVRREGIDLLEIVPSGDDGWIELPQGLTMRQRDAYAR
ncbi:MAG: pilus assembly protein PilP [Pseudomonadales bacterium]|nr:pilus assembly protein PilP [Pseudomonadales bacterium]